MKRTNIFNKNLATVLLSLGFLATLDTLLMRVSVAGQSATTWQIQKARRPEITISDKVVHSNDPHKLFGFNINFRQFQTQLWSSQQNPKPGVVEALKPFKGAIYRYPGGIVANSFHWREAIGDVRFREPQSSYYQRSMKPVKFGIDEYIDFVSDLDGMPWYVLNMVGLDLKSPTLLADTSSVAKSNLELSQYLMERFDTSDQPLYLQLGNELDRGSHQWSAQEYAARAKAMIDLINQQGGSEKPEFVSFLRDFKWRYKGAKKALPESHPRDFMQTVTGELSASAANYSLHHYYDGNRVDGKSRAIPFWLKLLARSIDDYRNITKQPASVWITEHGRQPKSRSPGKDNSKQSTSNMAAAISTADYLIAVGQFPEVKGAIWHGLNAGPWQLFDYSIKHNDLRPRPIYWGLRVLRKMELEDSLETLTASPNLSGYSGGYDIRAAAFRDKAAQQLGLRVVNRASQSQRVAINYQKFSGQKVLLKHYSASTPKKLNPEEDDDEIQVELEPQQREAAFAKDGRLYLELPAYSVSTVLIKKAS